MKYSYHFLPGLLVIACLLMCSCTKEDDLKEAPRGFLSPDNIFLTREGFDPALSNLYRISRGLVTTELYPGEGDKKLTAIYGSGTDLGWYWDKKLNYGDYSIINPTDPLAGEYWNLLYSMVKDCNVIISRLEVSPLAETDKKTIGAAAKFFRAYAYRFLVHLYGDVPKITTEITSPKFDYVRAPKTEVLALMIEDLSYASLNLPVTNPGNGKLSKAAADHLLTETYISSGDFDKAITAASRVINDVQYKLMTTRFGTLSDKPGDVFWDLFRLGNQNRSGGNMESILVWQMEFGVLGGEASYTLERSWGPYIEVLVDTENKKAILSADSLGRGVGFFTPSPYLETEIWQSDFQNDIRNSKHNMQREFYNNNPASKEFRQVIKPKPEFINRSYHVWVKKASSPYGHPQGYDPNGRLYTDIYAMRLAETYLLRAEAYLGKGDKANAAADINMIRARAKATPVNAANVDIAYILDERARELVAEEPRRLTLSRLGLLYDRVLKFNAVSKGTIKPFNNLLPIPQNAIDANSGAVLNQNPGY
ncbi:MAG: RagB/SusD family nutrient uptake outer membrane protein [Chitinophagaceae bacterium]